MVHAWLIWRATAWRAGREEEKEDERSMMGIDRKEVVAAVVVRRD